MGKYSCMCMKVTKMILKQYLVIGKMILRKKKKKPRKIFFFLLGQHLEHMKVPGLGVNGLGVYSELQLLAYTTPTVTPDPSKLHLQPTPWLVAVLDPLYAEQGQR